VAARLLQRKRTLHRVFCMVLQFQALACGWWLSVVDCQHPCPATKEAVEANVDEVASPFWRRVISAMPASRKRPDKSKTWARGGASRCLCGCATSSGHGILVAVVVLAVLAVPCALCYCLGRHVGDHCAWTPGQMDRQRPHTLAASRPRINGRGCINLLTRLGPWPLLD
jgi:hypothetical protein